MKNYLIVILLTLIICYSGTPMYASLPYNEDEESSSLLYEFKFGVVHHDSGISLLTFRREKGVDINLEAVFSPQKDFLTGILRPALGASLSTYGYTSKLYAGIRWEDEYYNGIILGITGGGAVHDGYLELEKIDRAALGSRFLFYIAFEAGYSLGSRSVISVFYDHISNGYLRKENEGLDTLGLRYGYRF